MWARRSLLYLRTCLQGHVCAGHVFIHGTVSAGGILAHLLVGGEHTFMHTRVCVPTEHVPTLTLGWVLGR